MNFNEYTRGVFEYLCWLEKKNSGSTLKREIDEAVTDIRRGVGVDFRERLRATMH